MVHPSTAEDELCKTIHVVLTVITFLISTVCSFFQELDEIRKSGMKNFRNIQVEESNLLAWQGLIVPVSCCSFFGCSEIRRPEVPLTNLIGSLSGQPSV